MQGFLSSLIGAIQSLLALFDSMVNPNDSLLGGEPHSLNWFGVENQLFVLYCSGNKLNEKRPLEEVLREHITHGLQESSPPAKPGRILWPDLPSTELETVYTLLSLPEHCNAGKHSAASKKLVADKAQRDSKWISKKTTSAHEKVIQQRDTSFKVRKFKT